MAASTKSRNIREGAMTTTIDGRTLAAEPSAILAII
jgi:hypothetical protein